MHNTPVIEGYKITEKIGEGATSVVWKAQQLSLNRPVVIKVLSDRMSNEPDDVKLFIAEAQTAAKLRHSGIVQVYDFGQTKGDNRYFFVMEYVSGYTVGEWVRRRGRLRESDAVIITYHVGEALKYAWDQSRVIHCDIKPDNLMVDNDGTVKVMDLGLAHIVFSKSMAAPGAEDTIVMGTPNYMSPEQAVGRSDLDCRTDIYALGMTLYHVLTGVLPYGNGDELSIIDRQIKEPLENPKHLNPDLSDDITDMVVKMMAKNIDNRYQNWSEVLDKTGVLLHNYREHSLPDAAKHLDEIDKHKDEKDGHDMRVLHDYEYKECPFCAELIRKKAIFCRYCGKDLTRLPPKVAGMGKTSVKLQLKPLATPVAHVHAHHDPVRHAVKATAFKYSRFPIMANLRMAVSLFLIVFLIFYWYNKFFRKRDILDPIRIQFRQQVMDPFKSAVYRGEEQLKDFLESHLEQVRESRPLDSPKQPAP